MTGAQIAAWDAVATLIDYPVDETYAARVWAALTELESLRLAEASTFARFRDAVTGRSLTALQQDYVAAFGSDPGSTLYMGWHLFEDGPNWARFLAMLAERLCVAGVPRAPELPDHLSRLLMLIAREDEMQAKALTEMIAPALRKVRKRLVDRDSPFAPLVETVESLLDGCAENLSVGRESDNTQKLTAPDPVHGDIIFPG
jgi:nitrate reductase assembly molybdenum cofactor insertion protein NarJ